MFFSKKKKPDLKKRFGSFAFYFSIPVAAVLVSVMSSQVYFLTQQKKVDFSAVLLFLHAVLTGVVITSHVKLERLRTLIHELKHAAVVIVTGNKLTTIKVGSGEGLVTYETYKDRIHLEPFVAMAPYFFPLFSLPMLVFAFTFEGLGRQPLSYLVGFFLGLDLTTSMQEIHGLQSDLRRIYGGYLATRGFIISANLLWISVVLVWIFGGRDGFIFLLDNLAEVSKKFAWPDILQKTDRPVP